MNFSRIKFSFLYFGLCIALLGLQAQEDYILGPGDRIRISVIGEPELTTEAEISPSGTITFWVLGDIKVADKSVAEFKAELTKILSEKYIKNPVVKVEILEHHSKEVVIQGAIKSPGSYYLDTNETTILKLISRAGSVTQEVGTYAYIIRGYLKSGKKPEELDPQTALASDRIEVNLKKLLLDGDLQEDKPVYGGDLVFISSINSEEMSRNFVWLEGAVKSPGRIPYQAGLTALSAVIQAGDFTDYAAPNRAVIHRKNPDGSTTKIKVKLKTIRKGKKPDVPLQPGDRLTIPESIF